MDFRRIFATYMGHHNRDGSDTVNQVVTTNKDYFPQV